jgi:hypothetical protein
MAKKTFIEDEDLEALGNSIITDNGINVGGATIKYLLVHPHISKTCVARCIKPSNELKHFGNFDYLIEFSDDIYQAMTDELKAIVMYHELKHILLKPNKKTGDLEFAIADHDVKDFASIINKHGIDWFTNLKTIASSVHDLENCEQDKLKI